MKLSIRIQQMSAICKLFVLNYLELFFKADWDLNHVAVAVVYYKGVLLLPALSGCLFAPLTAFTGTPRASSCRGSSISSLTLVHCNIHSGLGSLAFIICTAVASSDRGLQGNRVAAAGLPLLMRHYSSEPL